MSNANKNGTPNFNASKLALHPSSTINKLSNQTTQFKNNKKNNKN